MRNKSVFTLLIVVLLFVTMLMLLTSCKKDIKLEEKVVEIDSVEQFYAIRENVGLKYSKYTYNINKDLDLTAENWIPIGTNSRAPFMGDINGNNHTIKIKIKEEAGPEDRIRVSKLAEDRVHALIGYALDSKISNLNMDIDFEVLTNAMAMYSAGLVAFAEDKVEIENINIQGSITIKMLEILDVTINDDGTEKEVIEQNERGATTQYIGGVVAYAINDNKIINASSKVDVVAKEIQNSGKGYDSVENIFVGGIIGYTRLAQGNGSYSSLSQVDYEGSLRVSGRSVFLGGIVAASDYSHIQHAKVKADLYSKFDKKSNIGGIAGQLKHSALLLSHVENTTLNVSKIKGSDFNEASNVGGLTGYALDNTVIENCLAEVDIQLGIGKHFAGGFAGKFTFSTISDCAVKGGIELYENYNFEPLENLDFSKEGYEDHLKTMKFSAGMFGELIYKVTLGNLASEFKALFPISGAGFKNIISESVKGDLKEYLEKRGYGPYENYIKSYKVETQTKEQEEDGIVPHLVTFKEHVLAESSITYRKDTYFCDDIKAVIGEVKFKEFCEGTPYSLTGSTEVNDSDLYDEIANSISDKLINDK